MPKHVHKRLLRSQNLHAHAMFLKPRDCYPVDKICMFRDLSAGMRIKHDLTVYQGCQRLPVLESKQGCCRTVCAAEP